MLTITVSVCIKNGTKPNLMNSNMKIMSIGWQLRGETLDEQAELALDLGLENRDRPTMAVATVIAQAIGATTTRTSHSPPSY